MKPLPSSVSGFSAPDADITKTLSRIRATLQIQGDPNWRIYSDEDLINIYMPKVKSNRFPSQPKRPEVVREISTDELMDVLMTRERMPGYRSELIITPQMKQAIIRKAQVEIIDDSRANYGDQPFTIQTSYRGPQDPISDDLALAAIENAKTVAPFPVTDFAYRKQTKQQLDMNKRFNDRHPVSFNSIVEPLDSFAAFAEVAPAPAGGSFWSGLLGAAGTGAAAFTQTRVANLAARTASSNAQAEEARARAAASAAAKPTNWTPILIGGGVILAIVAYFGSRK